MTFVPFWSVALVLLLRRAVPVRCQVPGLVHTRNGYDRLGGTGAMCWWAPSFHDDEFLGEDHFDHEHDSHDHDEQEHLIEEDFEWESAGCLWNDHPIHEELRPNGSKVAACMFLERHGFYVLKPCLGFEQKRI